MEELIYPRLLEPIAAHAPSAVAFVDHDGSQIPFGNHVTKVRRLVSTFRRLGLRPGDKFAVLAYNSAAYIALWHAALFGGGVIVPLNHRLSERELSFILIDAEAHLLFVDGAHEEVGLRLAAACPTLRLIVGLESETALEALDRLTACEDEAAIEVRESDPALLMYTGGTTGQPKGVIHTQRNLALSVYRLYMLYDLLAAPSVVHLSAGLFHIAGMVGGLASPGAGATAVISRSFDAAEFVAQSTRHQITHAGFVVTMLARVLDDPSFSPDKLATLRQISYGGSPMPLPLLNRVRAAFPKVELLNAYGMTETGLVSALRGDDHRHGGERIKSVGRVMAGCDIAICDDAGMRVSPGEVGEICIKCGSALVGYHNRPNETAAAFRDGWYRSGDVGFQDSGGYVFLVDRRNDMIITGGENVYSSEVEAAILSHSAVMQVAVVGIPNEKWGEAVHAIVVLRPGMTASEAELIAHAREGVAGYKCPKSVSFRVEPLPLSGAGKVLKRELREPYWCGHDRAIG